MKKLGFGMMRLPLLDQEDPKSVDFEEVCRLVDRFLDAGFTYFDTAYMYHNYESERIVKRALVDRHPRKSFSLASKLPSMFLQKEGDQERIFEEQLLKCGVGYFDYYLIHNLNAKHYEIAERFDSFSFVSRLKREGRVRKIGFSFHDTAEVLDRILTDHPEVDFVQIQLNYLDWEHESIQSRLCYETCVRHGKPVIVMEPVKGGTLAKVPPRVEALLTDAHPDWSMASWAIRFAATQENVFMVLSGMSDMTQLQDNIGYMADFVPLNEKELSLLPEAVRLLHADIAVACTSCRYCVEGCPKNIEIPKYFELYNAEMRAPNTVFGTHQEYYENLTETHGKASDCIGCRRCEKSCPQHIRIVAALKNVAKVFETD
ncbi:MAG: aldo/keto reductase [Ruminococcaceae bacterium]|nr:aldo/keto reductase [Oscillospiraceae bacterium]